MSNEIKDFSRIIAQLENGQFNADCSQALESSLSAVQERCEIDGCKSATATISVTLKISYVSGNIEINADMTNKTPAKPRGRSIFWLSEDGKGICLDNPKQPRLPFDVISGKREVVNYEQERKDING